ncbi:hypothetical protein BKG77_09900 [Mycobacteroides chelonae]|uniref:DUF523 domain-containing protein n=1 Tax=Mycobacteroides chelonae TaxID=1774 RepID=UPI0008A85860|nr:DUF523 domain-containing protein [Mycobacteroides chelonae]OHU26361.1 hypothetical protein BKG77_09900 [Mycobacteroides chelonae]
MAENDESSCQSVAIVSACLGGTPCRYDGLAKPDADAINAVASGRALPLCAEVLGGLPAPRPAAEIVGGDGYDVLDGRAQILSANGEDFTEAFVAGAKRVADIAIAHGARRAILQSRSPSCGFGSIYDGTHSGLLRSGDGVVAAELRRRGIDVEERSGTSSADKG